MAPPSNVIPSGSVDHLIARQLPVWMTNGWEEQVLALRQAMHAQQACAERMQRFFADIPALDAFAAPLLEAALREQGLVGDVRVMKVVITQDIQYPSAAEKLYQPMVTFSSRQSLLAAAMHNFASDELQPSIHRHAHLTGERGERLPLSFERFAGLCRTLDIGARYQAKLMSVLRPTRSGRGQTTAQARREVEELFENALRSRLDVAVREGVFKGQLSSFEHDCMSAFFTSQPAIAAPSSSVTPRQLYLLGKRIVGVITVEIRRKVDDSLESVIAWIPGGPGQALFRHASWQALYEAIGLALRASAYREFFGRFIRAQDRPAFNKAVGALLAKDASKAAIELDGRNLSIDKPLFAYAGTQQIDKIFADARYLAVPTGDEDLAARHERLRSMVSAWLDLLGWAGLFVPVLGELMLVVSAAQLLDGIYEGYQDWRLGDRQAALGHLFDVAQALVVAGATAGAIHTITRTPFVDELVPRFRDGVVKLGFERDLPHMESNSAVLLQDLQPAALSRLISDDALDLLRVTGLDLERVRRLRVENAPAPARLLDAHERWQLHKSDPTLTGAAFEQALDGLREPATEQQALLMAAFKGLSPRAAQEVIDHSSSALLERLGPGKPIPLSLAERARWSVRESRLDRACLGIRLPQAINVDSESLVFGLLARKAPWPDNVRIELREGSSQGPVLFATGDGGSELTRIVVRNEWRYRFAEAAATLEEPLLKVVLECLDGSQKAVLGDPGLTVKQLRAWLLEQAKGDRDLAAQAMGLPAAETRLRPPRRFADGRLGYSLSGRGGESSYQAIRRGIHQIFPTLSELQLDAYLAAVRARGVNIWDHYLALQRQLESLRNALTEWQAAWSTPVEALRRRRVADTLRRSWRRKLVDVNDHYELLISGEHIAGLPTLPEGVDFAHVRRLVLRDMGLQTIDEDFLRRFPNIVELDLSNNRLTAIPAGIERLVQLRRIDLSNNRITIDAIGNRQLAQLSLLESIELSFNPELQAPDLSGLRHVRHLYLRSTGQVDIRQLLERASWRALVDLRDNRITELQDEVHGLTRRLQQLELHDNPLNDTSRNYLEQVRAGGQSQGGARGRPARQHAQADGEVREALVESRQAQRRLRREGIWNRLSSEPGSEDLFRFLAELTHSEDFAESSALYRRRIWRILEACEQSEELREAIFREVGSVLTCEDRLLYLLNQLEVGVLVQRGISGLPAAMVEQRLVELGRQLHRLDRVDTIAARHVERLRNQGARNVDEVEVRLYFRNRLARVLELPVHADEMHYASVAQVGEADLVKAQVDVLQHETPEQVLDSLVQRPFWQRYVRSHYTERFEALAEPYHAQLVELEGRAHTEGDQVYLEGADILMHALQAEEEVLIRTLAREAWERMSRS
ncbi:TPA: hypothetical protein U8251_000588 [Pseudomonas putida]|nr:hypothetical protein [Pseudomonas putida]